MEAFFDIEVAFNNVITIASQQALINLDVEQYFNNFLVYILNSSIVMSKLVKIETPQGDIISPLL